MARRAGLTNACARCANARGAPRSPPTCLSSGDKDTTAPPLLHGGRLRKALDAKGAKLGSLVHKLIVVTDDQGIDAVVLTHGSQYATQDTGIGDGMGP